MNFIIKFHIIFLQSRTQRLFSNVRKKLKESLDIRNKTILQLESQICLATSHISSRSPEVNIEPYPDQTSSMNSLLSQLLTKLDRFSSSISLPAINVYSSCQHQAIKSLADQYSQTDITHSTHSSHPAVENVSENSAVEVNILTCTICHNTFQSQPMLDQHLHNAHENSRPTSASDEVMELGNVANHAALTSTSNSSL